MNNLKLLDQSAHTLPKPAILLRELWWVLYLHQSYEAWAEHQLQDFIKGVDYTEIPLPGNTINPNFKDHAVSIEVAKCIALQTGTAKGRLCRDRLAELDTPKCSKPVSSQESMSAPARYYTVMAYADLKRITIGLTAINRIAGKANSLSLNYGLDVRQLYEPRFGMVNAYQERVLDEIIINELNGVWG